jgi:hypothetical protein
MGLKFRINMRKFTSVIPAFLNAPVLGAIGLLALSACAAPRTGSLPVQTVGGNAGSVSNVRIYERNDKLFVAGSAHPTPTSGGHIDIQLIAADGRVVATNTESLKLGHPRGSRSRHGNASFATSFPLSDARQAASVRVTFHSSGH